MLINFESKNNIKKFSEVEIGQVIDYKDNILLKIDNDNNIVNLSKMVLTNKPNNDDEVRIYKSALSLS